MMLHRYIYVLAAVLSWEVYGAAMADLKDSFVTLPPPTVTNLETTVRSVTSAQQLRVLGVVSTAEAARFESARSFEVFHIETADLQDSGDQIDAASMLEKTSEIFNVLTVDGAPKALARFRLLDEGGLRLAGYQPSFCGSASACNILSAVESEKSYFLVRIHAVHLDFLGRIDSEGGRDKLMLIPLRTNDRFGLIAGQPVDADALVQQLAKRFSACSGN